MDREFALRFTDNKYFTREEVSSTLSLTAIDGIWEKIVSYRNHFKKNIDLINFESKAFSYCFTHSICSRLLDIEKRFAKLYVLLNKLSSDDYEKLIKKSILNIAKTYAKENMLNVNDEFLMQLISKNNEVPQTYLSLKNYISTIENYLHKSASKFDISILSSFYGKFLRKEINPFEYDTYLRMIDLINPSDHFEEGKHYAGAPLEKILMYLNDLFTFNEESSTLSLIKAIITYFYIIYIKPFDYFNEECALLSMKYILANNEYDTLPFLLNLEEKLLNVHDKSFDNAFINAELNLDFTYFIEYIFTLIEESLSQLEELLSLQDISHIRREALSIDPVKETKQNPIVYEQKVSMPIIPSGLENSDIETVADNLCELYPSLKRLQALFYAKHCTIGKYYSIAQYKKETGVAYETARTSMDNLVYLGFYKKEQIKNKFVYTPVIR